MESFQRRTNENLLQLYNKPCMLQFSIKKGWNGKGTSGKKRDRSKGKSLQIN